MSASHQRGMGNAYDRRARILWMLLHFGDGQTCHCAHCGATLDYTTVTADRITPGSEGGTYRRDNLQPACLSCNSSRQDRTDWTPPQSPQPAIVVRAPRDLDTPANEPAIAVRMTAA
jgi:5-methylcytosine-specific restriction endonuclease McrA